MVFSNFFNFFAIFIECSITGREETQRNYFLPFSLFRSLSQPILARNEVMTVFSKFFNFFAIFLEPSITGRVGPQQNDFFYLHSFAGFPNLFWLVKKLRCCFLIFLLFLQNVQLRVGKKHNGTIYCLFSLSWPFLTYFGLKRSYDGIF